MNQDIFEGKFDQIKGDIEKTWGKVTDDELKQASGSIHKFMGFLQEKFGVGKDEASKFAKKHFGDADGLLDKGKDALGDLFGK